MSIVRCLALALRGPLRWSWRPLILLVEKPVLLGIIERVDHFRHQFILLGDLQHRACILVTTAVVCCGEDGEKLTACKPLKAIHDALVSTQDKFTSVSVEEVFDAIGTELDDISRAVRVSDEVRLDSKILIAISRVGP